MALLARIPWLWQTVTAFGVGWLGGWPGEGEDEGNTFTDTLINILLIGLGAAAALFAVRRLGAD
jgi:hypothetical protein